MAHNSVFDTPFDKLPNPRQVWVGKPGSHEEGLGKLALLTPEVVAEAAVEIKTGKRVTLGWEMTKLELANLNRQPCQHHIISLLNGLAFDDVYIMNPRMQHWAREGIAGISISPQTPPPSVGRSQRSRRGVLIDYAAYAAKRGIKYSTFSTHQIRLSEIQEIAKECNLTFKRGDILFVRIGVTNEWDNIMTDEQKRAYSLNPNPAHAGVEATTEMLRWLWDNGFSAVAGDAISWEVSGR
ncbi:hypothetical protein FQN50_000443 [Emmonsiellopsis sp. PD_5]|nr:hypothetical protein FQN50_000443 [Emmonsiellopsis sp. PD_5]